MADDDQRTEDETTGEQQPDEGPAVEELEQDPAYNPQEEHLKRIKGG